MMRSLVNIDPLSEFRTMEEWFDRMLGVPANGTRPVATLPLDITEKEGALVIRASVPGIDPKDLEVSIEKNVLTLRGETKVENESNDTKVYRREIAYGRVARSVRLPEGLDLNAVDAEFKNGMVTVTLPRQKEERPQALRVPVRTAEVAPAEPQEDAAS